MRRFVNDRSRFELGGMLRPFPSGVSGMGDTASDVVAFLSGKGEPIKTQSQVSVEASDRTTALVVFAGIAFVAGMALRGRRKAR